MAIKRCKSSFAASVDGTPRMYNVGQLVDSSDPVIKGREALFEDVETHVAEKAAHRSSGAERATAEPGEKRSVQPVRKPFAKKAAAKPQTAEKGDKGGQSS